MESIDSVAAELDLKDLRGRALDLLMRREHSRQELRNKLLLRDFPGDAIEMVLDDLEQRRYLSDERFAEHFADVRQRRGKGPVRIRAELRERGVAEILIERALEAVDEDWMVWLRDVYAKRFGGLGIDEPMSDYGDDAKQTVMQTSAQTRAKQIRFLQYRGFTSEQIQCLFRTEFNE